MKTENVADARALRRCELKINEVPSRYNPSDEPDIYKEWEAADLFKPSGEGEPFCMVMPPPNITGDLHLGHALTYAIHDTLARFQRRQGKRVLIVPGADHAAIAVQALVEKKLSKEKGVSRQQIGREEFEREAWEWIDHYQPRIKESVRRLGLSCDWEHYRFTLDDHSRHAVTEAFVRLYEKGLIYQSEYLVNWDPKLQTTIADDEIEYKEETAPFYTLKFGPFHIGTARPETKFGDKYVVMHPDDERYKKYKHNDTFTAEWINGPITATVIKDEAVDPSFGTGVMTITPWHDATDFELSVKHKLDKEPVIDWHGRLLPIAGEFAGLKISEARPKIVARLKEKGLLVGVDEGYKHRVATSYRGGGIVEPQIMSQWFVRTTAIKERAIEAVKSGQIKFLPKSMEKTYFHWLENLHDWCISRQLWWGHTLPVFFCEKKQAMDNQQLTVNGQQKVEFTSNNLQFTNKTVKVENCPIENSLSLNARSSLAFRVETENSKLKIGSKPYVVSRERPGSCPICGECEMKQSEEVLDTWFSSSLWPFSTLGWPNETRASLMAASRGETEKIGGEKGHKTRKRSGDCVDKTLGFCRPNLPVAATSGGYEAGPTDLEEFFPSQLMETAADIIFFWVARMIMMSLALTDKIPFRQVYFHGLVLDKDGQKMSKSKGNVVDPMALIEQHGADALRMSLIGGNSAGLPQRFSQEKLLKYRNFVTKVWNASRFVATTCAKAKPSPNAKPDEQEKKVLQKLERLEKNHAVQIEKFQLSLALDNLYEFFWEDFCNQFLEEQKVKIREDEKGSDSHKIILKSALARLLLLIGDFAPFVIAKINQTMFDE